MIRIKYAAPVYDPSGYGEFSRSFIHALHQAGAQIEVQPLTFDKARPNLGEIGDLCKSLERPLDACDIKIINATPQHFAQLREPGLLNVGFTMFETTRIPDSWVRDCNSMDAILVPCTWNREVFETSGVSVPIRVAAAGMEVVQEGATSRDTRADSSWYAAASCLSSKEDVQRLLERSYKFYSVFQWTERKNPFGLLKAYFAEFHQDDDVCLVLKTYRSSVSKLQQSIIKYLIASLKKKMLLDRFPPIVFVGGLLSNEQIGRMHRECDCFVLPHRAEGFGLPHLEAMAKGKPVIATGFSGNIEFMNPHNSRLLKYQLTPVVGMQWIKWYEGDMMWAEPDLADLRTAMREMHRDRHGAKELGRTAQQYVAEHFNWSTRIRALLETLHELKSLKQTRKAS